jgi:hypothetical protein
MVSTSTISNNDTLQFSGWQTPLTNIPAQTVGQARLRHIKKTRGIYHFEGMNGFEFYEVTKSFQCAYLQRTGPRGGWHTWMTDDPLHWTSMKLLCNRLPAGRILCAGLGLGLMVHHLCGRKDISQIHVIELSQDVIDLIKPTLPKDKRIKITNANFYDYIRQEQACAHDAVLWDLAVGTPAETKSDFLYAFVQVKAELPDIPLYQFGLRTADNIFGKNYECGIKN